MGKLSSRTQLMYINQLSISNKVEIRHFKRIVKMKRYYIALLQHTTPLLLLC